MDMCMCPCNNSKELENAESVMDSLNQTADSQWAEDSLPLCCCLLSGMAFFRFDIIMSEPIHMQRHMYDLSTAKCMTNITGANGCQ